MCYSILLISENKKQHEWLTWKYSMLSGGNYIDSVFIYDKFICSVYSYACSSLIIGKIFLINLDINFYHNIFVWFIMSTLIRLIISIMFLIIALWNEISLLNVVWDSLDQVFVPFVNSLLLILSKISCLNVWMEILADCFLICLF